MKLSNYRNTAFSLVEITLALGLVAFTLISLVGLFGAGMKVTKESGNDVALAKVAANVFASPAISGLSVDNPALAFLFDQSGKAVISEQEAFYKCDLTYRHAEAEEISGVSSHLRLLSLEIEWPGGKQSFHATAVE